MGTGSSVGSAQQGRRARTGRWLVSTAAAGIALGLALPGTAAAQAECGVPVDGTVTCTPAGNPYPDGIEYVSPAVDPTVDPANDPTTPVADLTVNLEPDVVVDSAGFTGVALTGLNTGAVTLNGATGTSISVNGAGTVGVLATTDAGSLSLNLNRVSATGDGATGILADSQSGAIAVAVNDLTVAGDGGFGVRAASGTGDVSATAGSLAVSGGGATGISALSLLGNATVDVGSLTTDGPGAVGIVALAGDTATVTVRDLATTGEDAVGIAALAVNAVDVTAGTVTTAGNGATGIYAASYGDVAVTAGSVATGGSDAAGVVALSDAGNVALDLGSGAVEVSGTSAALQIAGALGTAGENSAGAVVTGGAGGALVVNDGAITTYGSYSPGVVLTSVDGPVEYRGSGSVTTYGDDSRGIEARSATGAITIDAAQVSTQGYESHGIDAYSQGPITINAVSVGTYGSFANGVRAIGSGPITVTAGSVNARGEGAIGVEAISYGQLVSVTASGVSATGTGIQAAAANGAVRVTVDGFTSSDTTDVRIVATGINGDGLIGLPGSADGIAVRPNRLGTDPRTTFGADARPRDESGLADASLLNTAALTVTQDGRVQGGENAVWITSERGSTVSNAGLIQSDGGNAIRADGAAVAISNTGTISGALRLTDNDDRIVNANTMTLTGASDLGAGNDAITNTGTLSVGGTFALGAGDDRLSSSGRLLLSGSTDFGAGSDVLTNTGTIGLVATGTTAGRGATVTGLERLENSGLIELRNARANDVLRFTGANYVGSGSATIGVDAVFGSTGVAIDQLAFGTATGTTTIALAATGTAATLFAPTTFIQVTGASAANAFVLASASREVGLLQFGLRYDAADTSYALVSAPEPVVYRQVRQGEALTSLWNRTADAVTARFAAERDATASGLAASDGGRIWGQTFGETNRRKDSRDVNLLGLQQTGVDLGYRQDAFGFQGGADVIGGADALVSAGVTAGYANARVRLSGGSDRWSIDAFNVGGYGAVNAGVLFANALVKYDYYRVRAASTAPELTRRSNSEAIGAKLEAGLRFGGTSFFAEPAASIAYTRTNIDDFSNNGAFFDFDRFDGLRGKAGLRIGGQRPIAGGSILTFYAGGAAVHEFEGEDGLAFRSGTQTVRFAANRLDTFGQGTLGINVATVGGVDGFVEGHGEYGDDYRGGGARAGLRWRF